MSELIGRGIFQDNSKNSGVVTTAEFINTSINSGVVLDTVVFESSATNNGTLSGEVVAFYGNSTNVGNLIKSTPVFADHSNNGGVIGTGNFINNSSNSGTVTVSSSFADYARNTGTLQGSAFFVGNTTNTGNIEYAEITGNFNNTGTIASSAVFVPSDGNFAYGYYLSGQKMAPTNYVVQAYEADYFWYTYDLSGNASLANGAYNDGSFLFNFVRGIKKNQLTPTHQYIRLGYATSDSVPIKDSTVLYNSQLSSATVAANVSGIYDFDVDGNNEQWYTAANGVVSWYTISAYPHQHLNYYSADEFLINGSSVLKSGFGTGSTLVSGVSGIHDFNGDGDNERWTTNGSGIISWYTISAYPYEHLEYYSADQYLINGSSELRNGFGTGATLITATSGIYDFDVDGNNEYWNTDNVGVISWYTISAYPYEHLGYYSDDQVLVNGSSILRSGFGTGATIVASTTSTYDFNADGNNETWITDSNGIISWYTISAYPYEHLGYYSVDQNLINNFSVLKNGFGTGAVFVPNISGIYDFDVDGNNEQWSTNVIGVISWHTISAYPYKHLESYYSTDQVLLSSVSVLRNGFGTGATIAANVSGLHDFNADGNFERWSTDENGIIAWYTPLYYPYNHLGPDYYSADINLINGVSVLWNSPYLTATTVTNTTGYHDFDIDGNNEKWTTDPNGVVSWYTLSTQPYKYFGYYSADETIVKNSTVLKDNFGTGASIVPYASGTYDFDGDGNSELWYTNEFGIINWYTISAYPYEHFGYFSADAFILSDSSVLKTGFGTGATNASNIANSSPYLNESNIVSWWFTNQDGVITILPLSSINLEQGIFYYFGQNVYNIEINDALYTSNAELLTSAISGVSTINGVPSYYTATPYLSYINLSSITLQGTVYYYWGGSSLQALESGDVLYNNDSTRVVSNSGGIDLIGIPSTWSTDLNGSISVAPLSSFNAYNFGYVYYTGGTNGTLDLTDKVYNQHLELVASKQLSVDLIEGQYVLWSTNEYGEINSFTPVISTTLNGTVYFHFGQTNEILEAGDYIYNLNGTSPNGTENYEFINNVASFWQVSGGTISITSLASATLGNNTYYHYGSNNNLLENNDLIFNLNLQPATSVSGIDVIEDVLSYWTSYVVDAGYTRISATPFGVIVLNGITYYHTGGNNNVLENGDFLYDINASLVLNKPAELGFVQGFFSLLSTDTNGSVTITSVASAVLQGVGYYHVGGDNNVLENGDILYDLSGSRTDNNPGGIDLIEGSVSLWSTNNNGIIASTLLSSVTLNEILYYQLGTVLYNTDATISFNNPGGIDLITGVVSTWSTNASGVLTVSPLASTVLTNVVYFHVGGNNSTVESGDVLYSVDGNKAANQQGVELIEGTVSSWSTNVSGVLTVSPLASAFLNENVYYHVGGTNNLLEHGDNLYNPSAELVANNSGGIETIEGVLSHWSTDVNGIISIYPLVNIYLNYLNYYHYGGTSALEPNDILLNEYFSPALNIAAISNSIRITTNNSGAVTLSAVIPITLGNVSYFYSQGATPHGQYLYDTTGALVINNAGGINIINGILYHWSTDGDAKIALMQAFPVTLDEVLYYHYGGLSALESGDVMLDAAYTPVSSRSGVEAIEGEISLWNIDSSSIITIVTGIATQINLNGTEYYYAGGITGILETGDTLFSGDGLHARIANNPGGITLIHEKVSSWYTGPNGSITITPFASASFNGITYYHTGGDSATLENGDTLYYSNATIANNLNQIIKITEQADVLLVTDLSGVVALGPIAYWYTTSSNNDEDKWHTLTSWYTNSSHTTPATTLPTSATNVIVLGTIGPIADLDRQDWIQPRSINSGTTGVTFTSQTEQSVTISISGNVTLLGNAVYGTVVYPTYYWYTTSSNNDEDKWHTLTSWYTNSSHSIQSGLLPNSKTNVIVLGTIGPIADLDRQDWIQPRSINSGTTGVTFTSQTEQSVTISISGNATFLGNATYSL